MTDAQEYEFNPRALTKNFIGHTRCNQDFISRQVETEMRGFFKQTIVLKAFFLYFDNFEQKQKIKR